MHSWLSLLRSCNIFSTLTVLVVFSFSFFFLLFNYHSRHRLEAIKYLSSLLFLSASTWATIFSRAICAKTLNFSFFLSDIFPNNVMYRMHETCKKTRLVHIRGTIDWKWYRKPSGMRSAQHGSSQWECSDLQPQRVREAIIDALGNRSACYPFRGGIYPRVSCLRARWWRAERAGNTARCQR